MSHELRPNDHYIVTLLGQKDDEIDRLKHRLEVTESAGRYMEGARDRAQARAEALLNVRDNLVEEVSRLRCEVSDCERLHQPARREPQPDDCPHCGRDVDHRCGCEPELSEEPGYEYQQFVDEILAPEWGASVECWMTGGGTWNPVIVLERGSDPITLNDKTTGEFQAVRYIMFSMGWFSNEASIGYYNEKTNPDGWSEGEAFWYGCDDPKYPDVPMDAASIRALIHRFLDNRHLKVTA